MKQNSIAPHQRPYVLRLIKQDHDRLVKGHKVFRKQEKSKDYQDIPQA
jgi:hypothetical protein